MPQLVAGSGGSAWKRVGLLAVGCAVAVAAWGCRREAAPPPPPPPRSIEAGALPGPEVGSTGIGRGGDGSAGPRPRNISPIWARWPMPNPATSGLPHPAGYRTDSKDVVVDKVTGLMWQREVDPNTYAWAAAVDYCNKLNLADHDDWRLPSRIELVSIVDVTREEPAINPLAFPRAPSDWFWSSSTESVNPDGAAWHVYFFFGTPKSDPTNTPYRVRCVRTVEARKEGGGESPVLGPASPPYDVERDVVRDRGTGLTWQRTIPVKTFTFDGARRYCAAFRLGKDKDWRVPSVGELLTLIDERTTGPMIDGQAFPNTPNESFWTSSPSAGTTEMAWHVYFEYGNANFGLLKELYRVRCVH